MQKAGYSLSGRLRATKMIAHYHLEVLSKQLFARVQTSEMGWPDKWGEAPAVTIFITNINNRYPLELTLRTLVTHTSYPNYEIWVADNGSTDGSVELLEQLEKEGWPIRIINHGVARPQHEWYDFMANEVDTPYWVGIHEDMMFIADGWLEDLIAFMHTSPDVYLLGGQHFPTQLGGREPVSGELVDLMESLSTWIFCARKELRDHVQTSFAYHKYWDEKKARTILYDQGGKLIEDIKAAGLGYAYMPASYKRKWQHIANISWAFKYSMADHIRMYKYHQLGDVKRRVHAWQKRAFLHPLRLRQVSQVV